MAKIKGKEPVSVEMEVAEPATVEEMRFDKSQLAGSARFAKRRDLVNGLLEDGKSYTVSEVDRMIADFYNSEFRNEKVGEQ